ncbi:MAG TPA: hypothetical protein VMC09_08750 [Anaerolineales bacterium]|nr:hypothetical protein [Anaerolineales bacterium]
MVNVDTQYKIVGRKVIIRLKDRVCEKSEELLASALFREIIVRYVKHLERKDSPLIALFAGGQANISEADVDALIRTIQLLSQMKLAWATKILGDDKRFIKQPSLLYAFIEGLYDYWREFERFIVCDSESDVLDKRPYRTFNVTIESLMHLVRKTYRNIQKNISGKHPNIYRQVSAGAEIAAIALPKPIDYSGKCFEKIKGIPVIRQILLYPPLLLNPPMNKRTGSFVRVDRNPLDMVDIDSKEWLCYPARVGSLLVMVYFHEKFFELGFSLCNLFELADDAALEAKPDAVYLFGVQDDALDGMAELPTVFYDAAADGTLVAAIPRRDEFGYFGYLKKMILTLHNIQMMKLGKLPYHGAMIRLNLKNEHGANVLIFGDTGTGKSETLEAFRTLGEDEIREIVIIADDMGSLSLDEEKNLIGYGTEVGAFVRLDDLKPGFAFGQLDRAIIMSPNMVNARVILPVTTYDNVVKGYPVDMVLYANNYEDVDDQHPIIEKFECPEQALKVFREGAAMSKGTTTSTGLTHTYFANPFGPVQYQDLHDEIARRYFENLFEKGIFVGQLRTRLGIPGWERQGPEGSAHALLELLQKDLTNPS